MGSHCCEVGVPTGPHAAGGKGQGVHRPRSPASPGEREIRTVPGQPRISPLTPRWGGAPVTDCLPEGTESPGRPSSQSGVRPGQGWTSRRPWLCTTCTGAWGEDSGDGPCPQPHPPVQVAYSRPLSMAAGKRGIRCAGTEPRSQPACRSGSSWALVFIPAVKVTIFFLSE